MKKKKAAAKAKAKAGSKADKLERGIKPKKAKAKPAKAIKAAKPSREDLLTDMAVEIASTVAAGIIEGVTAAMRTLTSAALARVAEGEPERQGAEAASPDVPETASADAAPEAEA